MKRMMMCLLIAATVYACRVMPRMDDSSGLAQHQYNNFYLYQLNKDRQHWGYTSDRGKKTALRTYGPRQITLDEWQRGYRPPYWDRYWEYRSKESYCRKHYGRYPCSIVR